MSYNNGKEMFGPWEGLVIFILFAIMVLSIILSIIWWLL